MQVRMDVLDPIMSCMFFLMGGFGLGRLRESFDGSVASYIEVGVAVLGLAAGIITLVRVLARLKSRTAGAGPSAGGP